MELELELRIIQMIIEQDGWIGYSHIYRSNRLTTDHKQIEKAIIKLIDLDIVKWSYPHGELIFNFPNKVFNPYNDGNCYKESREIREVMDAIGKSIEKHHCKTNDDFVEHCRPYRNASPGIRSKALKELGIKGLSKRASKTKEEPPV